MVQPKNEFGNFRMNNKKEASRRGYINIIGKVAASRPICQLAKMTYNEATKNALILTDCMSCFVEPAKMTYNDATKKTLIIN